MRDTGRRERPSGWQRAAFRLPIALYRWRLGWLLGGRFVLLQHRGRVSGAERQVVLEVVERDAAGHDGTRGHDGAARTVTVASGFGPRADWYRNVLAEPSVTVQVGRRRWPATAVPCGSDEGGELMARYAPAHPRAARQLCRFMGFEVDGGTADYREVGRRIPFVRLVPR